MAEAKKMGYMLPMRGGERVQLQLAAGPRDVMFVNGKYTTSDPDEVKALNALVEKGYVRKDTQAQAKADTGEALG